MRRATSAEILALRHVELRPGLPLVSAMFDGDDTPTTVHVGAWMGADLIGCASFMRCDDGAAPAHQLRGMATRGDWVRRGVGSRLLAWGMAEVIATSGVGRFWCNARLGAVPFYGRQGWRIVSGVFDIPGVGPHHRMMCDTVAGQVGVA